VFTWFLILTLHLTSMGGGGDLDIHMRFTSEPLCKSVRRAIWSQMKDAEGVLGDCTPIAPEIPKP
jgi:hypothetical protein